MKKAYLLTLIFALCVAFLIPLQTLAASTASLTGPGTVRAGDTITLTFKVNGNGIYGASGVLSYDKDQLTLQSTKQKVASPWMVEFSGNNFVAYDNNLTKPIKASTSLFTVSFKVKAVNPGTKIRVSYTGVTTTDGASDTNLGTVSYSVTVAAPLSTNANLSALSAAGVTLSPAFSANTTSYRAEVPFSVSKLDLTATAADAKAKVSVDNPTLTPDGTTNVTVTVTAESGAKKTYTIAVHREKDPNYVPEGNNLLSAISVDGFFLSPAFDPTVTQYVVWLPYETESVTVSGVAASKKATVSVQGGESLVAGEDNPVKVICKAENGESKEYTVIVKRAAAHGTTEPPVDPSTDTSTDVTDTSTDVTSDPQTTVTDTTDTSTDMTTDLPSDPESSDPVSTSEPAAPEGMDRGLFWWFVSVAAIVGVGLGILIGFFLFRQKKTEEELPDFLTTQK